MRRLLLLVVPAVLLAVAGCAWYWLLHTEPGARWIIARVESAAGGRVRVRQLEGDLGSGLVLHDFELATERVGLVIGESRLVVDVDLLPPLIHVESATIRDVTLQIAATPDDRSRRDPRTIIRSLASPVPVRADEVRIEGFRASGVIRDRELLIERAFAAGRWHDRVELERLTVSSSALDADLSGTFGFSEPFATSLDAVLSIAAGHSPFDETTTVSLQADGDLAGLTIDVRSAEAGALIEGRALQLLDRPAWDLRGALDGYQHEFGKRRTRVVLRDVKVTTAGEFGDYSFDATGGVEAAGMAPADVALSGDGDVDGVVVRRLEATSTDARFTGTGRFDWGPEWFVESRLDVERFDLATLFGAWPEGQPLRGEISLRLDREYLAIRDSRVRAGTTDIVAVVDGEIDIAASRVSGDLEWQNFRWPVAGDEPAVTSSAGTVSIRGSIDDWQVAGAVTVATPSIPAGEFRIDGRGDRDHVEGEIVDSSVLGGRLAGYASFEWRGERRWTAGLDVDSVDIGSLLQGWPGQASGRVDASGQVAPFSLDLRIGDVSGELRDGALEGEGRILVSGRTLQADDLRLRHGDTRILLDGSLYTGTGLDFDIAVDELARYVGDAAGEVTATGRVSLDRDRPFLHIDARSDSLVYRGLQVDRLVVEDRSTDSNVIAVDVSAERAVIAGQVFDGPVLRLVADSGEQALDASATFRSAAFEARVRGGFAESGESWRWGGALTGFDVALEDGMRFVLAEPAALDASATNVAVAPVCLAAEPATRLCVSTAWQAARDFRINARFADVPIDLVNLAVDTRLEFDQLLNGNFDWRRAQSGRSTGQADIEISGGTIRSDEFTDVTIDTGVGTLQFDIAEGRLLTGGMQLPMPGFGHIDTRFAVHDVIAGGDSTIEGVVDVELADIALVAAFSSLIDEARGELGADIVIAGTLASPQLSGSLSVTDGAIDYLPIGLKLDDIDLSSTLHDDGRAEVTGTFRAGDGRGTIETRADYTATQATELAFDLSGRNLTLIDVPDVHVRADVDVAVAYDFRAVTLDGRVFVTHARIRPQNLDVTRDTESEDVVIVAGELPPDAPRRTRERRTRLAGALEVEIGDDFLIDLNLATATLSGRTMFTWQNGPIPAAEGRYDLAGSVQAFGQVLDISEGSLRFPRVPADDPVLRIRAEREIYGNSSVRTAGVLIAGTARRPTIEAYTRPVTTEERALALLVTGSDFDVEQGVGGVDFGTYIAPRLFVSYGVGLFERENVIRVRYDLSEGFGVTATSGQKESGVDLNYRIER